MKRKSSVTNSSLESSELVTDNLLFIYAEATEKVINKLWKNN